MTKQDLKRSSTKRHYEISEDELPLSCPMDDMRLWDGHPKVYLPIEKTGHVRCPYCEAHYTLVRSRNYSAGS